MSNRLSVAAFLATTLVVYAGVQAQDRVPGAYRLARDDGCTLCHEVEARKPNKLLPTAPAFEDIACRYRADPHAAVRLTWTVIDGTGPRQQDRHWAGRATFDRMYSNENIVSDAEAREIVDWILTLCPRPAPGHR
jgi:cytochrome c551/c552